MGAGLAKLASQAAAIAVISLAFGARSRADMGQWHLVTEADGTALESIAIHQTGKQGEQVLSLFNLGFGRRDGCVPELAVAVLEGDGYGKMVSTGRSPDSNIVGLTVDQVALPTPRALYVKYENGWEVVFPLGPETVSALSTGQVATVRMTPNTPLLRFPIEGAGAALQEAKRLCERGKSNS